MVIARPVHTMGPPFPFMEVSIAAWLHFSCIGIITHFFFVSYNSGSRFCGLTCLFVCLFVCLFQLASHEDCDTLSNLIEYLQNRQRRRQTLVDDLTRKRKELLDFFLYRFYQWFKFIAILNKFITIYIYIYTCMCVCLPFME